MNKTNYFILHNGNSTPFDNWYMWLYDQLHASDSEVYVPFFTDQNNQSFSSWESILNGYTNSQLIHSQSVFICHGFSSAFLIKYLVEHNLRIDKCIFVGGSEEVITGNSSLDWANSSFFIDDMKNFSFLTSKKIAIFSDNDPIISLSDLITFSQKVEAESCLIKGGGDFSTDFGFSSFPKLLEIIRS